MTLSIMAESRYAECHYAECHLYAHYAECRGAILTTCQFVNPLYKHSVNSTSE